MRLLSFSIPHYLVNFDGLLNYDLAKRDSSHRYVYCNDHHECVPSMMTHDPSDNQLPNGGPKGAAAIYDACNCRLRFLRGLCDLLLSYIRGT